MNPPIHDWREQRVWIIGASSGIGAATAHLLLARGARVALSARRKPPLETLAAEAPERTLVMPMDAALTDQWEAALEQILTAWGSVDLVIFMFGDYASIRAWDIDAERAARLIATNLTNTSNGLSIIAPALCARQSGGIALCASVAGYGGLPRALIYGATKAALINMAETLYLELRPRGVAVHLINPGFVRTQLTAVNDFHMPALLEPAQAAQTIIRGFERGAYEIAFPRRLAWPLKLLHMMPRRIYFWLVRRGTGT